jgi:hypothetical protein
MAIYGIGAAAGFARSVIACKASSMWRAIRAHIEGRNAVSLERERRTTLLTVVGIAARHRSLRPAGRREPPAAAGSGSNTP